MRILVINPGPFGTLIDAVKLCEYLSKNHKITHLSFDSSPYINCDSDKVYPSTVDLITVPRHKSFIIRSCRWYLACLREIAKRCDYDMVYTYYFPGCSVLRYVWPRRPMVLDIRTGNVCPSRFKRILANLMIWIDAKSFTNITVISEGLRKKLRISASKAHILPLGSERYDLPEKTFDSFHVLYLGNLYKNRKLYVTIKAFARLYHELGNKIEMTYTLVGGSEGEEAEFLQKTTLDAGVSHVVRFAGYIPHKRVVNYLASCNIGMAYVPITEFFDNQPPTKTFEYLMAGMPVLATGTKENKRLITETNGIITEDSEDAVFAGLKDLLIKRHRFDSLSIRNSVAQHSWEDIVLKNCSPYLEEIVQKSKAPAAHLKD